MSDLDLDAYCRRIGYEGPRESTLEVLRALHRLHPAAIAFENLDSLLGLPVTLDLASIQAKLIGARRGGYCYEQNTLFAAVLRAFGFPVTLRAARAALNVPAPVSSPRSHMALEVEAEGRTYLCDVGFGGLTQTAPLAVDDAGAQDTPHETWRLTELNGGRAPQARIGGEWRALYHYDPVEVRPIDIEIVNWYASTNPGSPFKRWLIGARAMPGVRYALSNNNLSIYRSDMDPEKRTLGSADELVAVLDELFDIEIPDRTGFARCFARWREEKA